MDLLDKKKCLSVPQHASLVFCSIFDLILSLKRTRKLTVGECMCVCVAVMDRVGCMASQVLQFRKSDTLP